MDESEPPREQEEVEMNDGKERHGCLTAWLALMIAANSIVAGVYLVGSAHVALSLPGEPKWVGPLLAFVGMLNVIFAIAMFQWKRWGFFGCVATSVLAFVVNLGTGLGIGHSLLGLAGLAVLFGVLQIGGEKKGWTQLE